MEELRTPFLIVALVCIALAVLVECGKLVLPDTITPGLGIPSLALLHGLVLFAALLLAGGVLFPARIHGRVQGISTFIVALLVLLAAIGAVWYSLDELLTMVFDRLLNVPFGTATYFIMDAPFERGGAGVTLSLLMTLELAFAICLALAQQRFLQNKSLVLLTLTALLGTVIISLLHGLVPIFLVSITDAIGALVVAILAAIWAIIFLVMSIPGIIRVLRVDRAA